MTRKAPVLAALFTGSLVVITGCEETGSGSAANTPNQGGAQSQLGRSVEMGKDLRNQIQGRDMSIGALTGGEGVIKVGDLSIPVPADWAEVTPSNSMRLAQFEADNGEVVIAVSQAGGTVDANISRWAGQVTDNGQPVQPDISSFNAAGYEITIADMTGDYTSGGMTGNPVVHNDYSLVGAIIDTGATKTFVKMTGPFSLVGDHMANFENMLRGIQKN